MTENKISETKCAVTDGQSQNDRKARAQTLARIRAVREGSQESFSLLLEQYRPLLESVVARFRNDEIAELSREDLRQEVSLLFYNSILTYDTDQQEVEFGLYAKICMTNGIISRMRGLKRRVEDPLGDIPSAFLSESVFEEPSTEILERERLRILYSVIRSNLSEYEYRVWSLYMSGRSAAEIGEAVGRDEKSVSNAIYRIRKKLRAVLR